LPLSQALPPVTGVLVHPPSRHSSVVQGFLSSHLPGTQRSRVVVVLLVVVAVGGGGGGGGRGGGVGVRRGWRVAPVGLAGRSGGPVASVELEVVVEVEVDGGLVVVVVVVLVVARVVVVTVVDVLVVLVVVVVGS